MDPTKEEIYVVTATHDLKVVAKKHRVIKIVTHKHVMKIEDDQNDLAMLVVAGHMDNAFELSFDPIPIGAEVYVCRCRTDGYDHENICFRSITFIQFSSSSRIWIFTVFRMSTGS